MDAKILREIIDEMTALSDKIEKDKKAVKSILELNKKFRMEIEK